LLILSRKLLFSVHGNGFFVLARVYLGITFFFSDHGNAQPNELAGFLKFALKNGYGWYENLLNAVVVPHSSMFGALVVIAEIYVGIALVLGFTTRVAASVALFFSITCAPKARCPGVPASTNRISFSRLSCFLATPAGFSGSISYSPTTSRSSGFFDWRSG